MRAFSPRQRRIWVFAVVYGENCYSYRYVCGAAKNVRAPVCYAVVVITGLRWE